MPIVKGRVASYEVEKLGEDKYLIIDLDDDIEKPSVTNSIDGILEELNLDPKKQTIICLGTDGLYSHYCNQWIFVGKDIKDAIKFKRRN